MTRASDIPAAIQWQEGMLLVPQHFQQLMRRAEGLIAYRAGVAQPFHWGVRRPIVIDAAMLNNGTLRVTELEAIMPDGLAVQHVTDKGGDLQLSLADLAEAARGQLVTVHLAVAARRSSGAPSDAELARYDLIDGEPVADENAHESTVEIARLKPRLLLLATRAGEPRPPDKYVSFPLLKIAYRDQVFVPTEFVPPTLAVAMRSPLGMMCADIANRLREKAVFLSDQTSGAVTPETQAAAEEMRATLRRIVSALPTLEARVKTGCAHPLDLYLSLTEVVGKMASVGGGVVPPPFDPYDHDDPRATFAAPIRFLQESLARIEEAFQPVSFAAQPDRFSLVMQKAWLQPKLAIGVRGGLGAQEAATAAWLEKALIGSSQALPELFGDRVRGAERRRIVAAGEYELLPRHGVLLYELILEPGSIEAGTKLEIWNPDIAEASMRPAEILLYVRINS